MQGQGSRLLGLDGLVVMNVVEVGDQLDLQVELIRAMTAAGGAGAAR